MKNKYMLTQTQKVTTMNSICVGKYLQMKMTLQNMNQVMITVDMDVMIVEPITGMKFI